MSTSAKSRRPGVPPCYLLVCVQPYLCRHILYTLQSSRRCVQFVVSATARAVIRRIICIYGRHCCYCCFFLCHPSWQWRSTTGIPFGISGLLLLQLLLFAPRPLLLGLPLPTTATTAVTTTTAKANFCDCHHQLRVVMS